MVDIGTLGGPTSGVSGINNAGRVVGAILKKNRYRPFVWDPARGMAELRVAGNKSYVKINDSGQVVGYYFTPKWLNFKERHSVFVWDPNRGAVELNLGLENVIFIVAFDINNKGQVLATVQVGPQENRVIMLTPKAGSKAADK
jgi:uncharacterized membrane protein